MVWNQIFDFIVLDPDPDPHWPSFVDPHPCNYDKELNNHNFYKNLIYLPLSMENKGGKVTA